MLGPIFAVDLVTSARRPRYFVLRILYGLVLLCFLWIHYYEAFLNYPGQTAMQQAAAFAGQFFISFAVIQLITVLIVGPAMAAATIASEREFRTIEYLFATDLTNREIVLSKLAARLLHIGSLIVAGLPVLAIAMLMGGIAPDRLLMVFVITLSTMVTVATMGIAVSVSSPRVRDAIARIYLILFVLLVLPGVVVQPLLQFGSTNSVFGQSALYELLWAINQPLLDGNPIVALWRSIAQPSMQFGAWSARWEPVLWMAGYQAAFSVLLAGYSLWGVRRVHLHSAGKATSKPPFRFRLLPRPRIGRYPMLWKESLTSESGGSWGLIGRLAAFLIALAIVGPVVWLFFTVSYHEEFQTISTALATLLACGGLLIVGARAASSITGERERDTWITLLSTPIESHEIILGKIFGTIWAHRAVAVVLAVIWFLQILRVLFIDGQFSMLGDASFSSGEYLVRVVGSVGLTLGTLFILALFASALGTLYSLKLRTSTRAIGATLGTLLFLGGGYLMCCGALFIGFGGGEEIMLAPAVPFLLAFPGMAIPDPSPSHQDDVIGAFILGNFGYFVAGVTLWGSAIANMNREGSSEHPTQRSDFEGNSTTLTDDSTLPE